MHRSLTNPASIHLSCHQIHQLSRLPMHSSACPSFPCLLILLLCAGERSHRLGLMTCCSIILEAAGDLSLSASFMWHR